MAIKELRTFKDIQDAVLEELKIPASDTVALDRTKRDINMIYLNEVIPYDEWEWMQSKHEVVQKAYIKTGTVSVTNGSKTITFSSAPSESISGYDFNINGSNDIYEIYSHTAGASTATLVTEFQGTTNSAANYRVVQSVIPLPVGIDDVNLITHGNYRAPLENLPYYKFAELVENSSQTEGKPYYFRMTSYQDPEKFVSISGLPASTLRTSSGYIRAITFASDISSYFSIGDRIEVTGAGDEDYNGEVIIEDLDTSNNILYYVAPEILTETSTADTNIVIKIEDRAEANEARRAIELYPKYNTESLLLKIHAYKEPSALEQDDDEPVIPLRDRIVLVYGALSRGWDRMRNPEAAAKNDLKYEKKLIKMAGKIKANNDMPRMKISSLYLRSKRMSRRRTANRWENF